MNATLPRNRTTITAPSGGGRLGWLIPGLAAVARHRGVLVSYLQVLSGSVGRLGLQIAYFFVLANTLSLHEMGIFASVSATGMLLSCFAGCGFQSFVFRAAASRRSSLGTHLGSFYACLAAAIPLCLMASLPLYFTLFADAIPVSGYLAIILVEVAFLRVTELLTQVNNGLGRFGASSAVLAISAGIRTLTALAFAFTGGGEAEIWSAYYFCGNAVAVAGMVALFHPRDRLRLRPRLLLGRLRDAFLFACSYFAYCAQSEVDKVIVLWLAGDRMAGIYAIAMRIVDMTAMPLRPMFLLYVRTLIRKAKTGLPLRDTLRIEAAVGIVSTGGLVAVIVPLNLWPGLLGTNITTATAFLSVLIVLPAAKNLCEFHSELFFAYDRLGVRVVTAIGLIILKAAALTWLLVVTGDGDDWAVWLNAIYAAIYVLSFVAAYGVLTPKSVPSS